MTHRDHGSPLSPRHICLAWLTTTTTHHCPLHYLCLTFYTTTIPLHPKESDIPLQSIVLPGARATVARWGTLNKVIYTGHEDGTMMIWDPVVCRGVEMTSLICPIRVICPMHALTMPPSPFRLSTDR